MDKTIDIFVNGSYLRKNHNRAGIQGEGNATVMHITFDEGWAEAAKSITFWDSRGENPVVRTLTADLLVDLTESLLEYNVPIPAEPMAHEGYLTFVIDGYIDGRRMRSVQDTLLVDAALITEEAEEPVDPTPSQAEQLQEQMEGVLTVVQVESRIAVDAANTAKEHAEDALSHADYAYDKVKEAEGYVEEINGRIEEAISIVNTSAEIANRAANSAVAAGKSAEEAKASAESIAVDEAYMEGVVNEAKGYAEQAKQYSEMAKENIEGDFVTNAEFEAAIKNLSDIETTSDKVILSDAAADSLNFYETSTMDDALTVISGALNELYENMENPDIDLDDYLPRDGSKPMDGALLFENGTAVVGADYKKVFLSVANDVFASDYANRTLEVHNAKYGSSNLAGALTLMDGNADGGGVIYKIYGEHNKPTAADTGALNQKTVYYPASTNKSADDLTDGVALISLSATLNSELATVLNDTFAYVMTLYYDEFRRVQIALTYGAAEPCMAIRHRKKDNVWTAWEQVGKAEEVTAESIGALPLSAGESNAVTGKFYVAMSSYPAICLNQTTKGTQTAIQNYGTSTVIESRDAIGDTKNKRELYLYCPTNTVSSKVEHAFRLRNVIANTGKNYNVFGEHNKPTGTYTGNGTSTKRTITVGGIGNLLAVRNGAIVVFATPDGTRWERGDSVSTYPSCTFIDGVLTINTADSCLNADGKTYEYYVL